MRSPGPSRRAGGRDARDDAVQNVGHAVVVFVNCPTRPFNHADPDKYRLPLDSSSIPFRF
jgi:hypothetical protein